VWVVSDLSAGDLQVNYGAIRGIDKRISKHYNQAQTEATSLSCVGGEEWPETGSSSDVIGGIELLLVSGHLGSGELIVKPTFVRSVFCFWRIIVGKLNQKPRGGYRTEVTLMQGG